MLEGKYTDAYLAEAGGSTPRFDDEMNIIASRLDFAGINVYKPRCYVEPAEVPGDPDQFLPSQNAVGLAPARPRGHVLGTQARTRHLGTEIDLYHRERLCGVGRRRRRRPLYDSDRVMFLRAFLDQLQHATSEGVPVDGYFLWSGQDNFEWGNRFGLIYVDFDTLERKPKLSAKWFRQAGQQNAVV